MSSSSPSFKITVKSHSQSPKTNTTRKNSEDKVKSKSIEMERFNEKYIKLLDDLAYLMRKKKEFMKAKAYTNARDTISRIKEDITAPEQIKDLPGIGKSIYDRLVDFSENKSLSPMRGQDDVLAKKRAVDIFTEIYGVGEAKAEDLVDKGFLTIEDLRKNQDVLNDKQKIGLKYYEDILKRIPRSEIDEYKSIFEENFKDLHENDGYFEIVGSYRRGAENSGDIDLIITSKDNTIFKTFIDRLVEKQVITEILSRGPTKCLVVAKIPNSSHYRRVDFLFSPPEEFPFAILYFTGSKEFNTSMREKALKMGVTLNEHGFSKMEGRKKGEKIENKGRFTQEKDIFDFLNMEFKEPSERVIHGVSKRNVTKKDSSQAKSSSDSEKTKRTTKKKSPESTGESCKRIGKSQNIMGFVEEFKKNGIQVLQKRNEDELASMIDIANNAFHCLGEPIMTDNEFDILREYMEKKFPKNAALNEVGATVEKNKVTLPYEMWSMDKIKPDTEVLNNWKKKYSGPYVVSCKLDGVSGLYTTEGDIPKLYTRGDGKIGQDISHMIPYLRLPELKGVVVRGEFIINRNTFKEKYESKFANPRNLVAGIVNQKKKEQDKYSDIHFVAYEMIKHPGFDSTNITPSQQMRTLTSMNFETVQNDMLTLENLTNDTLSNILQDWRSNYEYEIDGIIVVDDKVHPRTSGNPKHAFAFKMVLSDQVAEAHVVDVLWSASKDGYLKPRVQIMPIKLGGVTITYATGFNGAFIENNKIGIGAVIMLVRSGDVIPYIKSVTTPATQAKMPDVEYIWNDTHIDIMLKDKSQDTTVIEKNITGFFKQLEVDGIGSGNVKKIMKAGYNDICKIIHMSKDDLLKVEGFKEKTAQKLFDGIQEKIKNATVLQLAAASNMFGRGFSDKKLELIFQSYPNVLVDGEPEQNKIDVLQKIKGLERKTAEAFVRNIDIFKNFLKECRLESKLENIEVIPTKVVDNSHPLFDKNIVMTGFRNKELEQKIKDVGGKNASSVNSKTFVLLVKSLEDTSSKIEEAKKLEVRIMIPDDFIREYEL